MDLSKGKDPGDYGLEIWQRADLIMLHLQHMYLPIYTRFEDRTCRVADWRYHLYYRIGLN